MKGVVQVLCTPEVAPGFALAGTRPVESVTPEESAHRLRELLADPDCAIVLMQDRLYAGVPEEVHRQLANRPFPLVVPFPGPLPTEAETFEARLAELLRQAIGYRVRLR